MGNAGRVIIITGGSRGIGRAIALRFAEENARIVLIHYDPDEEEVNHTLNRLFNLGVEAEGHKVDVSSSEDVESLFKDVSSRFGGVDVLVNNAGITKDKLIMRMSERDWDSVIQVNLKGVFNCTKQAVKLMIKQRKGSIVNISSVSGQIGNVSQANYSASKAGIMGLTKSTAREVASRGVTVNAIAPGYIDTEMTAGLPDTVKEGYLQQIPLKRFGTPEDVAEAVYWLCSSSASYITGQVIHINGGMFM
ncbi:MAG: 3-oxoacyl-[acyl-carrier-protein] reductase [Deltaproteobacteria bacterium]|nr:3-oxoacyl-[acyl-carrier-protein] reductase [Deltaproteobacteria bacterium]